MKNILLSVLGFLLFVSCHKKHAPPIAPVPVNAYTVKTKKVLYYDKYPANIVALSQVDLRAQVQGYITEIAFKEGDHVHKGQKLYEIDRQLYLESYDQATANLQVAEGNLKQAQQDADRYTYLNSQDAVAKQILDHAVITLQNAKNTVTAAQQTLKMAATNLNYAVITAPFDGTIGFSQVKLGNMITVGQTILNTISTDDPMGVDFLISEKQLAFFELLKKNGQQSIDSLFTIILPNDSIYPFTGKISVIDRAVDPQTGTIKVRIVFSNPDHFLRPGTSCVLRVHNLEKEPKMVVPSRALVELMGEYFVYLVKDSTVQNPNDTTQKERATIAVQKKVQTGQTIAPDVIIKSGIKPGDKIVVDGLQTLHSGSIIDLSKNPNTTQSKNNSKGNSDKNNAR
jgi:membrane fusion protein (multidrug efflux system)